jgi:hypothetical protein
MPIKKEADRIRWGVERRLEFIEFRLYWEDGVNRADLSQEFGVSTPQASSDLRLYQDLAASNLKYDSSMKRYVATEDFRPYFLDLTADRYLIKLRDFAAGHTNFLDSWLSALPDTDSMPIPARKISSTVLREVLRAIRNQESIDVDYLSMSPNSGGSAGWRRISPHAFGFDGIRWHVRAFCHRSEVFKDFVLSRCRSVKDPGKVGALGESDKLWNETVNARLKPNPAMSEMQQKIIAEDYSMTNLELDISIRKALYFYFEKHLRLDIPVDLKNPLATPLVLSNKQEIQASMRN